MSKLPVVLLHGLNTTGAVWDDVAARLDRPASQPELEPLETVEAIADAVAAEAPARFHLAGYSFGGYVALALLERHRPRIESLMMVSSSAVADSEAVRQFRLESIARTVAEGVEANAGSIAMAFHPDLVADPALTERALGLMRASGAARYIAHSRACIARPDRRTLLSATDCPLMFVSGDGDRIVPLSRQNASAEAAGQTLQLILGAGHLLPMEQPAALAEAMAAWLAGRP
jgi:pimeloyl-ACP methyl ester carboxylesterase